MTDALSPAERFEQARAMRSLPRLSAFRDQLTFDLDPFRRQCLMEGLDEIGLTLARDTAISKFEGAMAEHRPWVEGRRGYEGTAVEGAGRT